MTFHYFPGHIFSNNVPNFSNFLEVFYSVKRALTGWSEEMALNASDRIQCVHFLSGHFLVDNYYLDDWESNLLCDFV